MKGRVTIFTSSTGSLAKTWSVDAKGELKKQSAAQMASGSYRVAEIGNVEDLASLLTSIGTNQALCTSLPIDGSSSGEVTTKARSVRDGLKARTKEHFALKREPGMLFIDCDDAGITREDLWAMVCTALPEIKDAGVVWRPSGSSHIWHEGRDCTGLKGQHLYALVDDVSQTRRIVDTLSTRLWLMGHGRVVTSSAGSMLLRCPVDTAPADAARLIFSGGAVCELPLEQRRGAPVILNQGGFMNAAVEPLTANEEQRYAALVAEAKAGAEEEARTKRAAHRSKLIADRVPEMLREGVSAVEAEQRVGAAIDAAYGGVLLGDFLLTVVHDDGRRELVTVGQVLADRERWNESDCLDPLNPGHRDCSPDCRLFLLGASPIAYSLDDGGSVYRLRRARETVVMSRGSRAEVVEALARIVAATDGVFLTDAGPVLIDGSRVHRLTEDRLMNLIGTVAVLVTKAAKGDTPMDVPREIARLVLANLN